MHGGDVAVHVEINMQHVSDCQGAFSAHGQDVDAPQPKMSFTTHFE
jgi:hypothetical protein